MVAVDPGSKRLGPGRRAGAGHTETQPACYRSGATALRFGPMSASSHPHFDDRGTLRWFTSLADARAEAAATGKRIFIEFGREL